MSMTAGKKRLTGSTFAKIVAFFLMAISFLSGFTGVVATVLMAQSEVYEYGVSYLGAEQWTYEVLRNEASEDALEIYRNLSADPENGEIYLTTEFGESNVRLEVWREYPMSDLPKKLLYDNYKGFETPYIYESRWTDYILAEDADILTDADDIADETDRSVEDLAKEAAVSPGMIEVVYRIHLYIDPEFTVYDEYRVAYDYAMRAWDLRSVFPLAALGSALLCMICFIFLMCASGHKNGRVGIVPGLLTPIPFDLLTGISGIVAVAGAMLGVEAVDGNYDTLVCLALILLVGCGELLWCTLYCMEAALRLKLGKWWKNTLIYMLLRLVGKGFGLLRRCVKALLRELPAVVIVMGIFIAITVGELFLIGLWGWEDAPALFLLKKIILLPILLYLTVNCKKLQDGSRELAEGNLNHKINVSGMAPGLRDHGENLNRISQGISRAVEERMKSERLKTELITNVSHDLKTPLTSIINYADLLGNAAVAPEGPSSEQIEAYSEVLLRQSRRLKKLLEDLVEASKATTGNLEINPEKCEVSVLLSQAVSEYELRFQEKLLQLIVRQPEEPVWILADGRHLWRIFDNLLNNICKYAQENSRVYLSVEPEEEKVNIVFRNMSKYSLEVSGEELEERFVRGDRSRHMEGNGLGLSIAKSLAQLQGGDLKIVTDGDLFKVTLTFGLLNENAL